MPETAILRTTGNLLKAQGRLDEAKKSYLEAIRIRPDFAIAWNNLAGVFKDEGDLETSVAYYDEAVRLSPDFADAWSNRGNALKDAGRLGDAKKAYKEAIRLRPDFAIAQGHRTPSPRAAYPSRVTAPCIRRAPSVAFRLHAAPATSLTVAWWCLSAGTATSGASFTTRAT